MPFQIPINAKTTKSCKLFSNEGFSRVKSKRWQGWKTRLVITTFELCPNFLDRGLTSTCKVEGGGSGDEDGRRKYARTWYRCIIEGIDDDCEATKEGGRARSEYGERSRWNKKGKRSFRREKTILLADELPTIYLGSTPLVSGVYILVDVIKRNKVDE